VQHRAVATDNNAEIDRFRQGLAAVLDAQPRDLLMRGVTEENRPAPLLEVLADLVQGRFDRHILISPEEAD
jgi:hypothetical protein